MELLDVKHEAARVHWNEDEGDKVAGEDDGKAHGEHGNEFCIEASIKVERENIGQM